MSLAPIFYKVVKGEYNSTYCSSEIGPECDCALPMLVMRGFCGSDDPANPSSCEYDEDDNCFNAASTAFASDGDGKQVAKMTLEPLGQLFVTVTKNGRELSFMSTHPAVLNACMCMLHDTRSSSFIQYCNSGYANELYIPPPPNPERNFCAIDARHKHLGRPDPTSYARSPFRVECNQSHFGDAFLLLEAIRLDLIAKPVGGRKAKYDRVIVHSSVLTDVKFGSSGDIRVSGSDWSSLMRRVFRKTVNDCFGDEDDDD